MWLNEKQQNTSARKLPRNGELKMLSRSEAIQSVNNRQQVSCRSWVKLVRCHHSGSDTETQARGGEADTIASGVQCRVQRKPSKQQLFVWTALLGSRRCNVGLIRNWSVDQIAATYIGLPTSISGWIHSE